jgi:hypothetical protein
MSGRRTTQPRELGFPITGVIHGDLSRHESELQLLHAWTLLIRPCSPYHEGQECRHCPFFNRTSITP